MNKILLLCYCFFALTSSVSAYNLDKQREIYSQAIVLQAQGKWEQAQKISASIAQYPLTYLLEYHDLMAHFSADNGAAVRSFISSNPNRSLSLDLERSYLRFLARNHAWDAFLNFYPQLPNSSDLKCNYFQAKISQGETEKVWPEFKKTWLTGNSLAPACDDVIAVYRENNTLSEQLVWQRFRLAYQSHSPGLMRYLTTWMKSDNKVLATELYELYKNPQDLPSSELFSNRKQPSFLFLQTSIKRLARVDLDAAMQLFDRYQKKIPFTASESLRLKKYFALRTLLYDEESQMPWLDKTLVSLNDDGLFELRIRHAIKLDNWKDIEYWLNALPPRLQKQDKWVYWQARVLENKQQQKQADKLYLQIAGQRSYYSFLAAQKMGLDYQLNANLVSDKGKSLKVMKADLAHISELVFQKRNALLKREWHALLNNNDKNTQLQLGLYAYQKGWSHLAVMASINSKSWDALNIRFPEVKPHLFANTASQYQLDPAYIYAITRQESAFDEYAKSSAGASGYMQLMPATAKETAKMIGMKDYKNREQLIEGAVNVQLGTAYFEMLLQRYSGNRILATAAYNAGPYRVDSWKGKPEQGLKMDSWIETIPYKETRNYVKNVLAYNVIYQHILNKPREFFNKTELDTRY
ncbi:MAG: soluble lytic murein transglycosylase [Psychromonas sp.]|uniref:transglycosylase SLT domain-containing protein n=1 Tax=Psychromonas sp. TaxID=1884585 RepID=UPI0039E571C0